jgi:hypothetical protein
VEASTALLVTAYSVLLGSVVGVLWHAVAPRLNVVSALKDTTVGMKPLIGQDVWLGLLGLMAGVVCVALLRVVAGGQADGPGAQIGLAAGGLLGMLVAERVGHLIGLHAFDASTATAVRALLPNVSQQGIRYVIGLIDLKVRTRAVLFGWPIVSVLLNVIIVAMRRPIPPTRVVVSAYSGSS